MKFTIDKSLAELGITSVVLAIARNFSSKTKGSRKLGFKLQSSRDH